MHTPGHRPPANPQRGTVAQDRPCAVTAEPELDWLHAAGLVETDETGGWKLTPLGEGAMARFYKQVEGSPLWRV